jgi:hypothetical protein
MSQSHQAALAAMKGGIRVPSDMLPPDMALRAGSGVHVPAELAGGQMVGRGGVIKKLASMSSVERIKTVMKMAK